MQAYSEIPLYRANGITYDHIGALDFIHDIGKEYTPHISEREKKRQWAAARREFVQKRPTHKEKVCFTEKHLLRRRWQYGIGLKEISGRFIVSLYQQFPEGHRNYLDCRSFAEMPDAQMAIELTLEIIHSQSA